MRASAGSAQPPPRTTAHSVPRDHETGPSAAPRSPQCSLRRIGSYRSACRPSAPATPPFLHSLVLRPRQRPHVNRPFAGAFASGASRDRTGDLLLAKQALSQLSYGPAKAASLTRGRRGFGVRTGRVREALIDGVLSGSINGNGLLAIDRMRAVTRLSASARRRGRAFSPGPARARCRACRGRGCRPRQLGRRRADRPGAAGWPRKRL